ncbi:30S ribosomal protein S8 [Candidatus Kaiserbacteria bacterium]|nr:30S ribosomal protein S8 [Candidatus Kaiserbacteria bacterium]
MVNDTIGDFIVRLTNAGAIKKASVSIPYSAFKMAVAEKLKDMGYIQDIEKKGKKVKKTLDVTLKYDGAGEHVIRGVKRVSKPGRRLYKSTREIMPVRYGHGALVLSTPKGVLSDKEARKQNVGGEALFEIW